MRRVIALLIAVCLSLGLLTWAHASVTEQETRLTVTPIETVGDGSVLEGRTATMDITCGDHLTWRTSYTFGADVTTAEFIFTQNPENDTAVRGYSTDFGVYLSGGMGMSTTGAMSLSAAPGYAKMIQTVAAMTPNGESFTMNLKLSDYLEYYTPEYALTYESDSIICDESMSVSSLLTGEYAWSTPLYVYERFMDHFRFPVQEDSIVGITVYKNDSGEVSDISFTPENFPTLEMIGAPDEEGIWFVPVFRSGTEPLEAELPDGMGIYFVPWRETGETQNYRYTDVNEVVSKKVVTPDADQAVNIYPIDPETAVADMEIRNGEAWLLTCEDGRYVLHVINLESRTETATIRLMEQRTSGRRWEFGEDYLTVATREELALVSLSDQTLELSVPLGAAGEWVFYDWDAEFGTLEYDGEHLILMSCPWYDEGLFWTAVYDHEGPVFCGRYDCSIFECNEPWYYNTLYARYSKITLD